LRHYCLGLSPTSEVEKGNRTVEGTDKTQVEKEYISLGDNVRAKKRKVSEGSGMTDREPLAKGKGKVIDDLEVKTKLGEAVKK
jgi:hypothetical protein